MVEILEIDGGRFKVNSPRIEKIDVVRHGQVRRAQLYYLRDRVGKAATLRERRPKGASPAKGTSTAKTATTKAATTKAATARGATPKAASAAKA